MILDSSRWAIGSVTNMLTREKQRQTGETHREKGNVKTEVEIGRRRPQNKKAKKCQKPEILEKQGGFFP